MKSWEVSRYNFYLAEKSTRINSLKQPEKPDNKNDWRKNPSTLHLVCTNTGENF